MLKLGINFTLSKVIFGPSYIANMKVLDGKYEGNQYRFLVNTLDTASPDFTIWMFKGGAQFVTIKNLLDINTSLEIFGHTDEQSAILHIALATVDVCSKRCHVVTFPWFSAEPTVTSHFSVQYHPKIEFEADITATPMTVRMFGAK